MQSEETVGIYFKQKIKKKTTERELNEREAMYQEESVQSVSHQTCSSNLEFTKLGEEWIN